MDEVVGQGKVAYGIAILIEVVVVAIATEGLTEAVAAVEHRGDTIETETVELILLHPEAAVGEQEGYDIILRVVEAERIPSGMLATITRIEVLVGVASKVAQALELVLHGVRLHHIHNHCNAVGVSLIDELLQLLGSTLA